MECAFKETIHEAKMEFSFTFESVIGGHHVYKFVWTPFVGEILSLGNENDPYAVAVMKDCCCWPMTKACAYNQGVLILEYFVQVENQYI